jgi:hypothetical protein
MKLRTVFLQPLRVHESALGWFPTAFLTSD